jgi:hypothetical protein
MRWLSFLSREFAKDREGAAERGLLSGRERGNVRCEGLEAPVARAEEKAFAFESGGEANGASIGEGGGFNDEALGLKGVDDAGHGWGTDLFSLREMAEGEGAGEDDHGESGQARRVEDAGGVGMTQAAQQMDGGSVEGFGGLPGEFGLGVWRICS